VYNAPWLAYNHKYGHVQSQEQYIADDDRAKKLLPHLAYPAAFYIIDQYDNQYQYRKDVYIILRIHRQFSRRFNDVLYAFL
jgi:hypothetical protein